jgi:hypothetical protein
MVFCGMRTTIHPDAKKAIEAYIIKLHEHPPTLQALVARAESLMPYIEEALHYMGVPEDLKYIAIQESRLNPYAVSRSLAVGYWQLKDYTAREVGLIINDTIDERRHLFRSTAGAALYFAKQYLRHRNWFFAIIAYYEGGTGAIPYLDSTYIGKDEICVYPTSHWYALRAIAHKLVFEPLIQRRLYPFQPRAYSGPPKPIHEIAAEYGLSPDSFLPGSSNLSCPPPAPPPSTSPPTPSSPKSRKNPSKLSLSPHPSKTKPTPPSPSKIHPTPSASPPSPPHPTSPSLHLLLPLPPPLKNPRIAYLPSAQAKSLSSPSPKNPS